MATMLGNKLYELKLNKEKADKDRELERYKADTQRTGLGTQLLGNLGSAMIKAVARKQDKSWHTRTLAGFAGSPTFANPPTGLYHFTDYEGRNDAYHPIVGYAINYRLLLGASRIDRSKNDAGNENDFSERNASSIGIARLYDKIRNKIGYSNNYDSIYLGQQIFVIRNLIVVMNELKKLYRAASTVSDTNPSVGLAIVADYYHQWGYHDEGSYGSAEDLRQDIRNHKAEFVTTYNDLVDRFNELVSIPQGFALLLRSAFIAENVFLDNKYSKTPIPYHFVQKSITSFGYARDMIYGHDFAETTEIADIITGDTLELTETVFHSVNMTGSFRDMFTIVSAVIDQFTDQTFRNLMGDIKSQFTNFWREEHLDVDEKLEVTYSEEVNQFVHNATVCGRLVKPSAGVKCRNGIFGRDGNIYQGYPEQVAYRTNSRTICDMPLMFTYNAMYTAYTQSILYVTTSDITDMLFNEFDSGDLILASSLQNVMTGCRASINPDSESPVNVWAFCPIHSRVELVENISYHTMEDGVIETNTTVGVVSGRVLKQMSVLPINFKHRGGNENNNAGLIDYNIITPYDETIAASLSYKDKTSLLDFFEHEVPSSK